MMSREQIVSQAQVIFREVLDSPELTLTNELTAAKVEGWDSLDHVTLVMTIEEHFKVEIRHLGSGEKAPCRRDARLPGRQAEQIARKPGSP